MPIGSARLSLLSFPQSWDGAALRVRFLCLPRRNPVDPLAPGAPEFANANVVLSARLVAGLANLPATVDSIELGPLVLDNPPLNKAALFQELTVQFDIKPLVPPPGPPATPRVLKAVTASYQQLAGDVRRSNYLRASKDYECALHEAAANQPADPVELPASLSWGKVIAYALRQPKLAEGLGLMGEATVTPPADFYSNGGWLFLDLHATSDYAAVPDVVARYAARIPPLSVPRPVFAAVLFPVDAAAAIVADDTFREAELFDDGIAKQVHGAQVTVRPESSQVPERGDSIQLAWDDEQIAIWMNRQMQRRPDGELEIDAPFGVAGYRIDVRQAGDAAWHSMLRIESQDNLSLGPLDLGAFTGEGVVEAVPTKHSAVAAGAFWLPSYFTAWRGRSLAMFDPDLVSLHAGLDVADPATQARLLNREKVFRAIEDDVVPLRYGRSYEFRVRLADLTRGGPDWDAPLPEPAASSVLAIDFKRRSAPGPFAVLERPSAASRQIVIEKPRLGHPDALFAGASFDDIRADVVAMAADPAVTREPGVFDPDVVSVTIAVDVKALSGDVAAYFPLYRTSRDIPLDTLTLPLDFQDHPTLTEIAIDQPTDGPLALPTARELRLTLTPIGRDDPAYFFDEAARSGVPVTVHVRAEAAVEADVLASTPPPATVLQSFFFQPPPADNSVAPPAHRLAGEVGLDQSGLTLSGRGGKRTVIGCSAAMRHTLSPERSAITFASSADLQQRWVNVVRVSLARDWTWDGLIEAGMTVTRILRRPGADVTEVVGTIKLPHAIAAKAIPAGPGGPADPRAEVRQTTELVFFDAIDPKPATGEFPTELTAEYSIQPVLITAPPPEPTTSSILLPVTTPPDQIPRIVSAGIALSPYNRADDYSSSDSRTRMLWFEFAEPPRDPHDDYFVRILGYAPDPLLLELESPLPERPEPPLPIDPESMRHITPGQARDRSGLAAMNGVSPSPRAVRHYLLPIPDDLSDASAELFGFFVYEVRVGHDEARWSTAQGRFGPALRVAGVQHPAPALECQAGRTDDVIVARAPFATPVYEGRNLRPRNPRSRLWALLYARVRQMDAAAWRNVLILQARLFPLELNAAEVDAREMFGECRFSLAAVADALHRLGLPADAPLTVLAAEMFGEPEQEDPLGTGLGHARILRVSPLIPVPDAC